MKGWNVPGVMPPAHARDATLAAEWTHRARRAAIGTEAMLTFLVWTLLLVFCWPLALLALLLYPVVWLLLLPFRILGIALGGVFEFLSALFLLPARVLRRMA
jgi:hypothetical protein